VSANVAFSLVAATASLVISSLSAAKGRWAVAVVFALLVIGFLVRALDGRREGAREATPPAEPSLDHTPPRRVKPGRFKRR
jgi:hypothetical protein